MANAASSTANILCFLLSTLYLSLLVQLHRMSWLLGDMQWLLQSNAPSKTGWSHKKWYPAQRCICHCSSCLQRCRSISPTQQRPPGCSFTTTLPISLRNTEHIPTEVSVDNESILGKLGPTRTQKCIEMKNTYRVQRCIKKKYNWIYTDRRKQFII